MLNIPLFKSASGQKTFHYRLVSIWNSMDSHLKTFESLSAFKFNLKRHAESKAFKSIQPRLIDLSKTEKRVRS